MLLACEAIDNGATIAQVARDYDASRQIIIRVLAGKASRPREPYRWRGVGEHTSSALKDDAVTAIPILRAHARYLVVIAG